MVKEFKYILVEEGDEPIEANNIMPNIVVLTEGEAGFTNEELASFNSTQKYVKLAGQDSGQDKDNLKEKGQDDSSLS